MPRPRVEERKKLEVRRGRKGRPAMYPTVNLTGNGYRRAKLEGNGWDKYYKRAMAKLAQEVTEEDVEDVLGPKAHIDESIKSVLSDIADVYEIQNPDYFGPKERGGVGLSKEDWVEQASKRPMYAGDIIRTFGQRTGQSAFETLGTTMMFDPFAQSQHLSPDPTIAEKQREFSTRLSEMDLAGNVGALALSKHPFLSFLANFGVPAAAVTMTGDVEREMETPHNRRPGLEPYVDLARAQAEYVKSNALLDKFQGFQQEHTPEEIASARARLEKDSYLPLPQHQELKKRDQQLVQQANAVRQAQEAVQQSLSQIDQAVGQLPDRTAMQKAVARRQEQETEELVKKMMSQGTNWVLAPKLMPAFSVLDDLGLLEKGMGALKGQEVVARGQKDWQLLNINSEPTSLIGEVGDKTLMEPLEGRSGETYEPGTELTPEIVEDLKAAGVDRVMAAHSPAWEQLAARYGDTAATTFAESVLAHKANRLGGRLGRRIAELPGVKQTLEGIRRLGAGTAKVTGVTRAGEGVRALGSRIGEGARSVPRRVGELLSEAREGRGSRAIRAVNKALELMGRAGRASRLGPLASSAYERLSRMAKSPKTLKALRGLKATGKVLGPIAAIGAGAWDVYEGLSASGQARIERALQKRWLDEMQSRGALGKGKQILRDLVSIPEAALWDPTHFQAMMVDNPELAHVAGSPAVFADAIRQFAGDEMDPGEARDLAREQFLGKYERAEELTKEYSGAYTELAEALPNVGPQTLDLLAKNAAYRRVGTRRGEMPRDRQVSEFQHQLAEHIEDAYGSGAATRAQELMRLVGDETFGRMFLTEDLQGSVRLNPVMMESLEKGSEAPIPSSLASWRNPFRREQQEVEQAGKAFQREKREAEQQKALEEQEARHQEEMKRIQQQQEQIRQRAQESEQRYQRSRQERRRIRSQRQLAREQADRAWERMTSPEQLEQRLATYEAAQRQQKGLPQEPLVPTQRPSLGATLADDYERFVQPPAPAPAAAPSVDQSPSMPQNTPVPSNELAQTMSRLKEQGVIGG